MLFLFYENTFHSTFPRVKSFSRQNVVDVVDIQSNIPIIIFAELPPSTNVPFLSHQNTFNSKFLRVESCCRQNLSKLSQSQDLLLVSSSPSPNKKEGNWAKS